MPWPTSQDYNEAIQSPSTSFADSELRKGEAAINALGIPMPCSGNFADVYQLRCPGTHSAWAIKCFTRKIPGLRQRYREISLFLEQARLPFMVDFTFLEQGVRIRGDWYPVLKMRWVEGFTLNQFVRNHLEVPQVLGTLCQVWLRLAKFMRHTNLGHCDLQHGNVLLVPGAQGGAVGIKLVDYDGMWVPALAGIDSNELGHPAYQHPQRQRNGLYSLEVDRFSHLAIYTALRTVLATGPTLWNRYDTGDNMLFTAKDFDSPARSPLFQELSQLGDPVVQRLTSALAIAAQKPLAQTPLLEEVVQGSAPAFAFTPAAPVEAPNPFAALNDGAARSEPPPAPPPPPPRARTSIDSGARFRLLLCAAAAGALFFIGAIVVLVQWMECRKPRNHHFVKVDLPGHLKLELRQIAAGGRSFQMGSPDEEAKDYKKKRGEQEADRSYNEHRHEITFKHDYYLGVMLVSQAQFKAITGTNPGSFSEKGKDSEKVKNIDTELEGYPVEFVSWDEANDYCKQLTSKTQGFTFRLPTEAEWEFACRAGDQRGASPYYLRSGPSEVLAGGRINFDGNSPYPPSAKKGPSLQRTSPCGSFSDADNEFGLRDMHGNVWEWCQDCYTTTFYQRSGACDESACVNEEKDHYADCRVVRGGAWDRDGACCRAACRNWYRKNERVNSVGFRVCAVQK